MVPLCEGVAFYDQFLGLEACRRMNMLASTLSWRSQAQAAKRGGEFVPQHTFVCERKGERGTSGGIALRSCVYRTCVDRWPSCLFEFGIGSAPMISAEIEVKHRSCASPPPDCGASSGWPGWDGDDEVSWDFHELVVQQSIACCNKKIRRL